MLSMLTNEVSWDTELFNESYPWELVIIWQSVIELVISYLIISS